MSEVRFEPKEKGIEELLKSPAVAEKLQGIITDMCDKANDTLQPDREDPEYMCAVDTADHRAPQVGHVWAQGEYAKNSNALHNTLVRLLFGGR